MKVRSLLVRVRRSSLVWLEAHWLESRSMIARLLLIKFEIKVRIIPI